jgi:hypothetical protein
LDRQIVWPGAIPLETDILSTNRNAMIGLGHLAQAILGSGPAGYGLACTPTNPASLSVQIGPGSFYSLQPVDATAYSSLPANTADLVMKQGVVLASKPPILTFTPPQTPGTAIVYLVEAAFSETDSAPVTLPFFNSANPSQPLTGPNNSGGASYTVRQGGVAFQVKAGVPAAIGAATAPVVDAGYTPLHLVTVAYGQTAITQSSISSAPQTPLLQGFAGVYSPSFQGAPSAPTPSAFDSSQKLATTAFVQRALGNYQGCLNINASSNLTIAQLGAYISTWGAQGPLTLTLPQASSVPNGGASYFIANQCGYAVTVASASNMALQTSTGGAISLAPGAGLVVISDGQSWICFPQGGWAPSPGANDNTQKVASTAWIWTNIQSLVASCIQGVANGAGFSINLGAAGYLKLPSWLGGWMIQWNGFSTSSSGMLAINWPIAFPSACVVAGAWDLGANCNAVACTAPTRTGCQLVTRIGGGAIYAATSGCYIAIGY